MADETDTQIKFTKIISQEELEEQLGDRIISLERLKIGSDSIAEDGCLVEVRSGKKFTITLDDSLEIHKAASISH